MIVYNISVKVDSYIEQSWLQWQQDEHIPEILRTTLFLDHKIFKLLGLEEDGSSTYIIQFSVDGKDNYDEYQLMYAEEMMQKAFTKWGNGFIAYKTLMQQIV
jgi:hypothetical protein